MKKIVELAHAYEIPVLVDEAHGVHIHFHDELPLSAMQAGADMAATSVHKLGGSLTQSSILNVREGLVSPNRIQSIISMLTTTSTSYLLLASLDVARRRLAIEGEQLLSKTLELAELARQQINYIPGLSCIGREILGSKATFDFDPTKLIISTKSLGISGYEVEKWLRDHANIEVELSDLYNILCIVSFGDTELEVDQLIGALTQLSKDYRNKPAACAKSAIYIPDIPVLALSPRDAFYSETEVIPFDESAGRTIAEFIMVYPPGIPVLIPGEIISDDNLAYIRKKPESWLACARSRGRYLRDVTRN